MDRQRRHDSQGVMEDDLNDIKADISSFRYELLEILQTNGMKTPQSTQRRRSLLQLLSLACFAILPLLIARAI
ncbi:unnamed protein product [Protopolystoma xenopodis]|uniref:Uncharacterized protein n=1 Tax=Protopolystoma xenopodis TaxID=117903 RepID=A0A448WNL4_9PLAT|nr:unnamed protein product [Protopolystoma xenopodis]